MATHHSKKGTAIGIAVIGCLVLALMYKQHLAAIQPEDETGSPISADDGFQSPYVYQSAAGNPIVMSGNSPFTSVVNVNVDSGFGASLATAYIPMFGFVGVVASAPSGVNAVNVPSAPVQAMTSGNTAAQWLFYNSLMSSGVSAQNRNAGLTMLAQQNFNPWG